MKLAKRLTGIPLLQLDLVNSNLPDDMCDGIVLLNVLEYIKDHKRALRQIRLMLRPTDVLVLEVPAGPRLYDHFDRLVDHVRRYRMAELIRIIEAAEFRFVDHPHLGFFAYPAFWLLKRRNQRLAGRATISCDKRS